MIFSKRLKLAEKFELWRSLNGASNSAVNVITFLSSNGYLKDEFQATSEVSLEERLKKIRSIDIYWSEAQQKFLGTIDKGQFSGQTIDEVLTKAEEALE